MELRDQPAKIRISILPTLYFTKYECNLIVTKNPSISHHNTLKLLVRTAGLEPALPYEKQILSLLRLPFRHVRFGRASRANFLY